MGASRVASQSDDVRQSAEPCASAARELTQLYFNKRLINTQPRPLQALIRRRSSAFIFPPPIERSAKRWPSAAARDQLSS